jgi:predicted nucleic acid-binding Zn finger protein
MMKLINFVVKNVKNIMKKKKMPEIDLTDKALKDIIKEMLYYDHQIKMFRILQLSGREN